MKRIICLGIITIILSSCGSYRSLDLNRLTTGMTKAQVQNAAGLPDRILAVNETDDGYQEVLEYRTSRGEIYALEFWNDYLTGYEYLYEEAQYVPYPYPPTVYPPYGRPLYIYSIANRPGYYRPGYANRPPNYQNRPPANNNRPGTINRPSETTRPPVTRPSEGNSITRPSTTPNRTQRTESSGSGTTNSNSNRTTSPNRTNRNDTDMQK